MEVYVSKKLYQKLIQTCSSFKMGGFRSRNKKGAKAKQINAVDMMSPSNPRNLPMDPLNIGPGYEIMKREVGEKEEVRERERGSGEIERRKVSEKKEREWEIDDNGKVVWVKGG